ncbi:unnamed protein product [Effrenium voratum]|nr:unnamed protein product [Effrenium voratum]
MGADSLSRESAEPALKGLAFGLARLSWSSSCFWGLRMRAEGFSIRSLYRQAVHSHAVCCPRASCEPPPRHAGARLMGLFDGLGSYDSEQRRAAVVRKQVQLLDEQIAEKERRKAQKEQERVREKQEEREQFRTPHAAQVQPASYHMQRPPEPAQFSVSPNAVPFAINLQAAPAPAQPSFLQQLQQQLLYQPLLQLPSLLSQPPQQQLPQLPALPKRSFWEVPSFDVSVRNPHAVLPSLPPKAPRAESVDSRRDAIASRMPSSASAVAAAILAYGLGSELV